MKENRGKTSEGKGLSPDEIATAIDEIFAGLMERCEERHKPIIDIFKAHSQELSEPEVFDLKLMYPICSALNIALGKGGPKYSFVFLNYTFVQENIEYVINRYEGRACQADKSSWLISQFINWEKEGVVPDMANEEKCFWKPGFGTWQHWVNYFHGLRGLLFGKPGKYFESLKELFEEGEKAHGKKQQKNNS